MASIKIGENEFEIPPPTGMRSFMLQQRIFPVAGRVISALAVLVSASEVELREMDLDKLMNNVDVLRVLPLAAPELGKIFADMPPGELETLTRELLRDGKVKMGPAWVPLFGGTPLGGAGGDVFDQVMIGRSMDVWLLLWFALRVWYPDFFSLVVAQRAKPTTATP